MSGDDEIASTFHFPRGRMAAMHAANLTAELGNDAGGSFVAISTDRLAQSVNLGFEGFIPDDNWFHLAPGPGKIVRLRPFGPAPERISGEIRQLGSAHVISI
jgi:beta-mannosidase